MTPSELRRFGVKLRHELKPFVDQHPDEFYGDFAGACGVMSYAMAMLLRQMGEKPTLAIAAGDWNGCKHCWVEVNGFIVDLTATQFGYKKPVQVVTRPSEWHRPFKFRGAKAIAELKSWYGYQNPLADAKTIRTAVDRALTAR